MSKIDIVCIKYAEVEEKKGTDIEGYSGKINKKVDMDNSLKLEINSSQLFMNTERFFNTVKSTLEKYFDEIVKKS